MIDLDDVDLKLLDLLQQDAGRSNQALAEAAGISPATALRRVRRLVEAGAIERVVALVAPALRPDSLTAIVEITLDRQDEASRGAFEARVSADAAVQQCYRLASGPDFVLVLWVPGMSAYQALAQRLFTQDANVRNVRAYFSARRAKFEPRLELGAS